MKPRRFHNQDRLARVYDGEIVPVWSGRFARMLLRRLKLPPRAMVLDVGTGEAAWSFSGGEGGLFTGGSGSARVLVNGNVLITESEGGLMWIQAEHRVRPELLVAQTGYMQGAAGIGSLLLELDAAERGRTAKIHLPDSPFGR